MKRTDKSGPCTRKPRKKDNNPYATRGLDKFSALLAELQERRQEIYSQIGSEDISLVRFVYSSSNDCVPVIVKIKDPLSQRPSIEHNLSATKDDKVGIVDQEKRKEVDEIEEKNKKTVYLKANYMPVFVMLILVVLAISGRSVPILCASVWWYLVPTLSSETSAKKADSGSNLKKKKKKFN